MPTLKYHKVPMITGTRYVLAVKDLESSGTFYETMLGFETVWKHEGWHMLRRDKFTVMLGECPDDRPAFETVNHSYFAYVDVDNIDELYAEFKIRGVHLFNEPMNQPWGQREFGLQTIDGHRMTFGQALK